MSYEAIVAKLSNVREHPNADRLKMAYANGFTIIVGLDAGENDIVVLFPPDGQLSEEYAEANDLVGYTDPETHERKGGYFAKNRRVCSQKLRGEKSEAYVADLDSFAFTGFDISQLKVGDKFDTLNGVPICNKYFTPATLRQMNAKQRVLRANKCFPKHVETEKLQYEINRIEPGSIIYITEKLHGTSGRYALVQDEKDIERKWYHKLLRRPVKKEMEWDFFIGTRNMVLVKIPEGTESFYGSEEFRHHIGDKMRDKLHKGEIIYGEIVGYTHTGAPIMGEHDASKIREIKKQYGPKMTYSYGNVQGNCEFYVYRIARVNEDGFFIDLSWPQVKARCAEIGLKAVPEMGEYPFFYGNGSATYRPDHLIEIADYLMEGSSMLDESHIREGVVFRVESPSGKTEFFKSKSFTFGVLEGYLKNDENMIDLEEVS
jgi:hypothetical protein